MLEKKQSRYTRKPGNNHQKLKAIQILRINNTKDGRQSDNIDS